MMGGEEMGRKGGYGLGLTRVVEGVGLFYMGD